MFEACLDLQELDKALAEQHREVPAAYGMGNDGNLVKVYTNPETGTWTMTVLFPDKTICIFTHGSDWKNLKEKS